MINFKKDGSILICEPHVQVVASNVPEMRDTLIDHLDSDDSWDKLIFDCSQVDTLDSIGINLIVGLLKKTKATGKAFEVHGCNETIIKVFKLFRLTEQFVVEGRSE
ncbi:MAG: anti-anti-sigma factor [bacterium]|jgi:anti-anti-sigma factor